MPSAPAKRACLSTGGSVSGHQWGLVRGVLAKAAGRRAEIVLAANRDEAGQKLMQDVAHLAPEGTRLFSKKPTHGKD